MRRGLIIGKFMPLHEGHLALIRFAADKCDELIVSMSYKPDDPINGLLRFSWITSIFENHPKVKPELTIDNFDDESLPLDTRTEIWARYIEKRLPPLDFIFTSEEYGTPFAAHLGVKHFLFDKERLKTPVSATQIRQNPFKYWEFIPPVVRPYFVKKICFYGPESTGKSSLAKFFAEKYQTEFVPEVARELIDSNDFSTDDIIKIGTVQTERVAEKLKSANKFLFCDTDLITTEIYSQHYLHAVPEILFTLEKKVTYDLYFLLNVDIEWVADGLRDLGSRRREMFNLFKAELDKRDIRYCEVAGSWEMRVAKIQGVLNEFF